MLRTEDDRLMASVLLADASVRGARLRSEGGSSWRRPTSAGSARCCRGWPATHGVRLHEVTPTDESLESVFSYLVSS